METLAQVQAWLSERPDIETLSYLAVLLIAAWFANFVVKKILLRGALSLLSFTTIGKDSKLFERNVIARLANVVPALVIAHWLNAVPNLSETFIIVVDNVAIAFIILTVARSISGMLTVINTFYERDEDSFMRPIKGYIQVVKIGIYVIASILVVAALIDKSPVILLSGLGAMAAVVLLVFQDTLLSLVASVQISSNDIIRVGDWVEMPNLNADGDVIDIALHQVKVQNFDKTITFIPTKRFISDPFKNWRGMQEAGGRRIKRSFFLDQQSIHFLTSEERDKLRRFRLLNDYLSNKQKEIDEWNEELKDAGKEPVNTRRISNIGTFRAYVLQYLKSNPFVHQDMTLMVRQLNPTADGVPLEIYCFTTTTKWAEYESIQSDIFDHLFAIVSEFGLRVFQHPSGVDMRSLSESFIAQKESEKLEEKPEEKQE